MLGVLKETVRFHISARPCHQPGGSGPDEADTDAVSLLLPDVLDAPVWWCLEQTAWRRRGEMRRPWGAGVVLEVTSPCGPATYSKAVMSSVESKKMRSCSGREVGAVTTILSISVR